MPVPNTYASMLCPSDTWRILLLVSLVSGDLGAVDHQLQPIDRPWSHLVGTGGERDRAGGPGRSQLDEAQLVAHLVVVVGAEA